MEYNNMNNIRKNNNYLVSCVWSILLLLMIGYFGIGSVVRETYAGFGGITACLVPTLSVNYSPNFPDGFEEPSVFVKAACESHKVIDNMFESPTGYIFAGWNTMEDGSGGTYYANTFAILSGDTTLYAQWALVEEDEEEPEIKNIYYGDVNENGEIDSDDYLLIEKYLNDPSVLNEQALLNADVNGDGKIDLVDVDIVKQAYLGTEGYTGYLPNNIIPIYSLYDEDNSVEEDNPDVDDVPSDDILDGDTSLDGSGEDDNNDFEEDSSDNTGGSIGSNTGGTGNGNSENSGGNTSGNGSSSNGNSGNKPNSGSSNQNSNVDNDKMENSDDKKEELSTPKIYKFKFMNGNEEYANTMCDVLTDGACQLVLPENNPTKKGYLFTGWSLTKDCPSDKGITKSILVNTSNTYYACFIINNSYNKNYNTLTVGLIIVIIWIIAIGSIYYLIKRFKNTEIND